MDSSANAERGFDNHSNEAAELLSKLQEESKERPGFVVIISISTDLEFNCREKVLADDVYGRLSRFVLT